MKFKSVLVLLLCIFSLNASDHFVSFIIPCYNCALTVEESIESIYQQDLKYPFEVICTNDGSSDTTLAVLEACQKKYPNLYIYNHDQNRGGGAARNTCVKHTQGDIIFCLDSDNVLCPRTVGQLIDLIDTGCDVATFEEGKAFRGNREYVKSYICSIPGYTYDIFACFAHPGKNPAYGGNYLFTRKSYDRAGGYPEDLGAVDTFGFGLAQLATGSIMKTVPGSYYWHRLDDNSYYVREERKNTNMYNYCRVLYSFYRIFSRATQEILDRKNVYEIWYKFESGAFELAYKK